jgi:hypothetical protein
VQRPEDTAFLDEYMIHGGARHARISVWAGFSALGLTRIHVIEGNLDSTTAMDKSPCFDSFY